MSQSSRKASFARRIIALLVAIVVLIAVSEYLPDRFNDKHHLMPTNEQLSFQSTADNGMRLRIEDLEGRNIPTSKKQERECADPEAAPLSCFQEQASLKTSRISSTSPTPVKEVAKLTTHGTLSQGTELIGTLDQSYTIARESSFWVPGPEEHSVTSPLFKGTLSGRDLPRPGLTHTYFMQRSFPQSYLYFDQLTLVPQPIDYADAGTDGSFTVSKYKNQVTAFPLLGTIADHWRPSSPGAGATVLDAFARPNTMPGASLFTPDQLYEQSIAPNEAVAVEPFVTIDRKVDVEPRTGTVINTAENYYIYYARDGEEAAALAAKWRKTGQADPMRNIFSGNFSFDDATIAAQENRAKKQLHDIHVVDIWYWVTKFFAVVLAIVIFVEVTRYRRREARTLALGA